MRFRPLASVGLLLLMPALLVAQEVSPAPDDGRVLVLEHRFGVGAGDSVIVPLELRVMYWAEVTGPGTPTFQPLRRRDFAALVVPVKASANAGRQRFEVHASAEGLHVVRLAGLPPGDTATLRFYRDTAETSRWAESRDRSLAIGLLLGGGIHSGYRLDPTGGDDPRGGSDLDACFLIEGGSRFGGCIGIGRQRFPDAHFAVTWFYLEPRFRLFSGRLLGDRRTDLGASFRMAQAPPNGSPPAFTGFPDDLCADSPRVPPPSSRCSRSSPVPSVADCSSRSTCAATAWSSRRPTPPSPSVRECRRAH